MTDEKNLDKFKGSCSVNTALEDYYKEDQAAGFFWFSVCFVLLDTVRDISKIEKNLMVMRIG